MTGRWTPLSALYGVRRGKLASMLEHGSGTGLPGKYRITLAISIALLLHTLVMSALPFTPPEREPNRRTLRVELSSPGSHPSSEYRASAAAQPRENQPTARPDIVTLKSPRYQDAPPEEPSEPSPRKRPAAQPAETSAPSRTSVASAAGNPEATAETETVPELITRISRSPQETDPYLAQLAARVGSELDKHPVPSSHRITEPVTMELELQLMHSGALTSAKVTQSTGYGEIDKAVYQAALLASPYPEPPQDDSGRKRFRVELIFTPERL
ncbi:MAG: TonB family protein [Marinobacter sp.]|uniref:TonB family protein n=1 Tax=Marinobacter sp. TaxID=50741 RepID=UPI003299EB22